jgi:recombinational DNA repair protein RecR
VAEATAALSVLRVVSGMSVGLNLDFLDATLPV